MRKIKHIEITIKLIMLTNVSHYKFFARIKNLKIPFFPIEKQHLLEEGFKYNMNSNFQEKSIGLIPKINQITPGKFKRIKAPSQTSINCSKSSATTKVIVKSNCIKQISPSHP